MHYLWILLYLNEIFNYDTQGKKGITHEKILEIFKILKFDSEFDAFKYCGIIKLNQDPLSIQKN